MKSLPPIVYSLQPALPGTALAPLLVLLHGHGGNENNLSQVAAEVPPHWIVVSLRAPFEISPGRYKWYTVDSAATPRTINLEEEASSRTAILNLIEQLSRTHSVDLNKVVLAGFSQGAIMALNCALSAPQIVAAAAVFSGRFLPEIRPQIHPAAKRLRVLLAHGREDKILPIQFARENRALLKELGIDAHYEEDDTGHILSATQKAFFLQWLSGLWLSNGYP